MYSLADLHASLQLLPTLSQPSARDFKDIYVVFELMETDLHQVGGWGAQTRPVATQHAMQRDPPSPCVLSLEQDDPKRHPISLQVIKANDDLTPEHHQFFLYQMLRGLKYIHSAKVRGVHCLNWCVHKTGMCSMWWAARGARLAC